ncbi:hypothetical protein [Brunnivagina elsteri]|uniref:Uncharacterized protein n=1 Tax=Brunnivagina elsteri CCALA 953 TaxID=987040 RepID=A0A2A2TLI5_9CYAN|nr:hypothetical protein [Calothrix elsteri]PAX58360.1 hypothetical protein CK510_07775 [Calothrix elsteri CCALA 953]
MVKTVSPKGNNLFKIEVPLILIDSGELPGSIKTELTDKPAELSVTTYQDECDSYFDVNTSYWYIKFPRLRYYTRSNNCKPPSNPSPKPPLFPTPPVIESTCNINGLALAYEKYYVNSEDGRYHRNISNPNCLNYQELKIHITQFDYSTTVTPLGRYNNRDYYYLATWICEVDYRFNSHWASSYSLAGTPGNSWEDFIDFYSQEGWDIPSDYESNGRAMFTFKKSIKVTSYYDSNRNPTHVLDEEKYRGFLKNFPGVQFMDTNRYSDLVSNIYIPTDRSQSLSSYTYYEPREDLTIDSVFGNRSFTLVNTEYDSFYGRYVYSYTSTYRFVNFAIAGFICIKGIFPPPVPEKLPPPPPKPMSCCPNVRENDALLKLIAKRIGVYDYPVSVPKIITDESQGNISLENLTRFTSYLAKQLDAVSGNYPIEIEIADSDLTQEGNQKQTIKIPNAAEGIAEALGQLLVIRSETNAILNATIRALVDIASTKQATLITHDYARANSEFLGYKGKQVMRKVPFAIDVGKERLDELLQESEIEIKGFENDDKDDIKDLLIPLMDMAAMYRTQNFRNLGKDTLGALRELLNRNSQTGEVLNNDKIKKPDIDPNKQENRFDSFIENAETGFINKAGITDNANPYGRPYEERPKIREIGDSTGST